MQKSTALRVSGVIARTLVGLAVVAGMAVLVMWSQSQANHLSSAMRWGPGYEAEVTWSTVGFLGSCVGIPVGGALLGRLQTPSGRWIVPSPAVVGGSLVAWILLVFLGLLLASLWPPVTDFSSIGWIHQAAIVIGFAGPFVPLMGAAVTGTLVIVWREFSRAGRAETLRRYGPSMWQEAPARFGDADPEILPESP